MSFGGHSVNKNTETDVYDDTPFTLRLPNLDSIIPQLETLGDNAHLFKVDVARSFHNVRIDPGDAVHLGIFWNGSYYLDKNLSFGVVHGTAIFQRISDLVRFLMTKRGFRVQNYIDDIYAVYYKDQAYRAYVTLKEILNSLGLPLNNNKVFALQSLLGKLLYVSHCAVGSRHFLNCMFSTLRQQNVTNMILPNHEFQRDLLWFIRFLIPFNGAVSFKCFPVQHYMFFDAILAGLGAVWGKRVYTDVIPHQLQGHYSI